jgi:hypothetical protein
MTVRHHPSSPVSLRVEQDGKTFTAKKDFVWTCNEDTKEQAFNDGRVVATMRITDLKA